jgi:hypothetical protein
MEISRATAAKIARIEQAVQIDPGKVSGITGSMWNNE